MPENSSAFLTSRRTCADFLEKLTKTLLGQTAVQHLVAWPHALDFHKSECLETSSEEEQTQTKSSLAEACRPGCR